MTDHLPSKERLNFSWTWDADARNWRISMVDMGDGFMAGYDHLALYYERRLIAEIERLNADLAWIRRRTGFWGEVPQSKPASEREAPHCPHCGFGLHHVAVDRYYIEMEGDVSGPVMMERVDQDGEWVRYEDHKAEIDRLRACLTGIQSCSTCEACRGAAERALGGDQCPGCEGWPKPGNNPCAVCGLDTRPSTVPPPVVGCIHDSAPTSLCRVCYPAQPPRDE